MTRLPFRHLLLTALAAAWLPVAPLLAADPQVKDLVGGCAGCHGQKGLSAQPVMPTLAGMDAAYFTDIMLDYKDGTIESPMMKGFAQFPRESIEAMADYYAAQDYVPMTQKFDAEKARRGEALHEEYCGICHRDGGSNAVARELSLPPLAGQGMFYLRNQMDYFRKGTRPMPAGKAGWMNALMRDHGEEGVDAVLNYYASQQ